MQHFLFVDIISLANFEINYITNKICINESELFVGPRSDAARLINRIFRLAFPHDSHYNLKQKETDIKLRRMLYGNQEIHTRKG